MQLYGWGRVGPARLVGRGHQRNRFGRRERCPGRGVGAILKASYLVENFLFCPYKFVNFSVRPAFKVLDFLDLLNVTINQSILDLEGPFYIPYNTLWYTWLDQKTDSGPCCICDGLDSQEGCELETDAVRVEFETSGPHQAQTGAPSSLKGGYTDLFPVLK